MSILIKEMAMPKNCLYCPMSHWNKLDEITGCEIVIGKKYVDKSDTGFWQEDRPKWCPLVEIPKHGRLIDADELHERINETVNEGLIFSGMTIAEFIEALIDDAPTIIEGDTE